MSKYTQLVEKAFQENLNNHIFKERTRQSLEWYRRKIQAIFGQKRIPLEDPHSVRLSNPKLLMSIDPGRMYSFKYRPKGKYTLPYYDVFPLVLVLKKVPSGFLGLNFHYLRPQDRADFMDKLYNFEKYDPRVQDLIINITYNMLKQSKRLKYYRACIKRYRYANIGNLFVPVTPSEWDMALFLPTELFIGESKQNIWEDSREKYK